MAEFSHDLHAISVGEVARPLRRSRAGGEMDRKSGHPGRAEFRIVQLHHSAYLLCVLGVYPLRRGADKPDRRPGPVAQLLPGSRGAGEEQLSQPGMQALVDLRGTVAHEIEQVWPPVGDAGRPREPGEVPGAGCIELDIAPVSAAVGPGAASMDSSRWLQSAGVDISARVANQGKHGAEQLHLDALASSRALAGDQGHDNPSGGKE